MAYRAKTLRKTTPTARKLAQAVNTIESVQRRLKNLVPQIQELERTIRNLDAELPAERYKQTPESKQPLFDPEP